MALTSLLSRIANGFQRQLDLSPSIDVLNRLLKDASAVKSVDYANRRLYASDGTTIQLDWSTPGTISLQSSILNTSGTPVNPGDLTTKTYVDNISQGLNWKETVRSATTAALPAYTYVNGTLGVGATISSTASVSINPQDGVTLIVGDRLLVKDEVGGNLPYNGIYVVTQVGSGVAPFILTRATDADTVSKLQWATVEVGPDAVSQTGYIYRESADLVTMGTSSVTFALVSKGLAWVFGNGLLTVGNNVSVLPADSSISSTVSGIAVVEDPAGAIVTGGSGIKSQVLSTGGIQISSNSLALLFADSSLTSTVSGASVVEDAAGAIVTGGSGIKINLQTVNPGLAITTNKLDVKYGTAGAIVASATGIAWNPDNSSLEINTNAARIKTTAYDQVTITGGGGVAASVAQTPVVAWSDIAGQTFVANTTYAVRYGLSSNGETAGRVYACDTTTSSFDLFWAIGFIQTTGAVSAGQTVTVIFSGSLTLKSADTLFAGTDSGKPIFLQAGGTNANTTPPSTTGLAVAKLGIVQTTTTFRVQISAPYVA